jgi:hypothetical protein
MEHELAMNAGSRFMIILARSLIGLSFLALLGAWGTQATGNAISGFSQEHLFNDATVLALLGIACFIDAFWHTKGR